MVLKSLLSKLQISSDAAHHSGFQTAKDSSDLFIKTSAEVDGPECLHDCATCTIKYPSKFKTDEDASLYGHVNGWETHLVVATGKTDWVRDVADEKGSIMEAIEKCGVKPNNGNLKISASNMPLPDSHDSDAKDQATTVILLPAFTIIDNVTPSATADLITHFINPGPTNTMTLDHTPTIFPELPADSKLLSRPCPHDYLILLCSHKTRDARCGQSAPLLRKEFERHLRPLGLYRDLDDERPGGVGIYFINHVGGHKFSANVIIYRRATTGSESALERRASVVNGEAHKTNVEANGDVDNVANGAVGVESNGVESETTNGSKYPPLREAVQGIWLARVRPEDCENIVRYTILQGKVLKPERQLRGGFDRQRGLISW